MCHLIGSFVESGGSVVVVVGGLFICCLFIFSQSLTVSPRLSSNSHSTCLSLPVMGLHTGTTCLAHPIYFYVMNLCVHFPRLRGQRATTKDMCSNSCFIPGNRDLEQA